MATEDGVIDDKVGTLEGELGGEPLPTGGEPAGGEGAPAPAADDGAAEMRSAIADLAKTVKAATAPKTPDFIPLTDDQKAELWGIYDPEKGRKDFFQKFFRMNPEATPEEVKEVKELWADVQRGLVRQAVVGARNLHEIDLQKFRETLAPLFSYVNTVQARERQDRFYNTYGALKDEKYNKVIDGVARGLAGRTFESEGHYFKALAEGAAEVIKGVIPNFDLGKQPKTKSGTTPRVPRSSVGGTGGAGKGAREDDGSLPGRNDIDSLEL